jgi:hypothetical protein
MCFCEAEQLCSLVKKYDHHTEGYPPVFFWDRPDPLRYGPQSSDIPLAGRSLQRTFALAGMVKDRSSLELCSFRPRFQDLIRRVGLPCKKDSILLQSDLIAFSFEPPARPRSDPAAINFCGSTSRPNFGLTQSQVAPRQNCFRYCDTQRPFSSGAPKPGRTCS